MFKDSFIRSWEHCMLCPLIESFPLYFNPGPVEPARIDHMFNFIEMFLLHVLVWYLSWMLAGTVSIDVVNTTYIVPLVLIPCFMMSLHILRQRQQSPFNIPFISLHKPDHIYISIVSQADNILHIIGLSLKDLLSIPIVKSFLEMWSLSLV